MNKQREHHGRRAKENTFKVGDLVLYENNHRTKLAKQWYTYYRIVRKHREMAFTIQHVGTGIEKRIYYGYTVS